jgi:5'-3' exonuclease
MPKKIYLIDWNSFIYRMFFALPEFATKDWKIVNAIFGMAKFFVSSLVAQSPDYLIFIKDAAGDNFRHKLYADYKATRDRMPDSLRTQIWDIEKMIGLMWIDIVEVDWYEADDVIGTLATKLWKDVDNQVFILSWDKDLYSLITDNVFVYDTMKRTIFNPEKATEKFWVKPEMIIDYLSIVWDKADNIPGIDWFWPKKAVDLINIIWTVEQIYNTVDDINSWLKLEQCYPSLEASKLKSIESCFKWKTFEKLVNSKEDAFLSKKLATIELNIDLDDHLLIDEIPWDGIVSKKFNLEDFKFKPDTLLNNDIKEYFKSLEFFSLIWETEDIKVKTWYDLWLKVKLVQNKEQLDQLMDLIVNIPLEKEWSKGPQQEGDIRNICLHTETTSINIIEAKLIWISIYIDDNNIFYINRLHKGDTVLDIDLKNFLKEILDLDILIVWHNLKYDLEIIDLFINKEISKNLADKWNSAWQMSFEV